jgi:predicted DsbA family dithiol-disulfide isomerase
VTVPAKIRIDIVSDVVCPWCVIGYRQLERAIGQMADRAEVSVRWHPFELAPGMPIEGQLTSDYMAERYGASVEQGRANRDRLIGVGAPLGIDFRYSDDSRIYNSFNAHQLLCWAGEVGGQTRLQLALFHAYFTDQVNIAETDVLLDVVESVGLDRVEAAAVLDDQRYAAQVRDAETYWHDQNVTGVPAYIVNGTAMIPGAQDADTFVRVLDKVIARAAMG